MESLTPAETTLQLLFKKLHPHLEDAAHALASNAPAKELERLHAKLLRAREQTAEVLEDLLEDCDDDLAELIGDLATNLTPVGENYQQSLTLTQLCLEEAPADLLPYVPEGRASQSPWGKRMESFLAQLENPAFEAHARWTRINPEIGDEDPED
ncbi:MAG: hypothetical protein Q8O00_14020 [Holophaga sp.]|nr:hypothetical protein [Holophaga sp.]